MYNPSVIAEFEVDFEDNGTSKSKTFSCSGICLDSKNGLILTTGLLFSSLLDYPKCNFLDQLRKSGNGILTYTYGSQNSSNLGKLSRLPWPIVDNINASSHSYLSEIQEPAKNYFHRSNLKITQAFEDASGSSKTSIKHKKLRTSTADAFYMWKSEELFTELRNLLGGWTFDAGEKCEPQEKSNFEEELLSVFILIKLKTKLKLPLPRDINHNLSDNEKYLLMNLHRTFLNIGQICKGDPALIIGTPFGALSPDVFFNSVTKGVISNMGGKMNELLFTDARCIPGGEGSALYVQQPNNNLKLVGMIIAPLCWKQNEWVGLSLACNLAPILSGFLNKSGMILQNPKPEKSLSSQLDNVLEAIQSVVLVRVGTVWGSGVILDREEGLIITCSHVVREHNYQKVKIVLTYPYWFSVPAQVVFATPEGSVFDLAILRVPFKLRHQQDLNNIDCPLIGQNVLTVGHALFDEHSRIGPTITTGNISKIVHSRTYSEPIMIQSSCAVHAGASGGALVSVDTGNVIGIIVCNSRDLASGASYPHVNMSVPFGIIAPVIQNYLKFKDVDILNEFHLKSEEVEKLWQLQQTGIDQPKSKL